MLFGEGDNGTGAGSMALFVGERDAIRSESAQQESPLR